MRPGLRTGTSSNISLYLVPVLPVELKALKKLFMLIFCPLSRIKFLFRIKLIFSICSWLNMRIFSFRFYFLFFTLNLLVIYFMEINFYFRRVCPILRFHRVTFCFDFFEMYNCVCIALIYTFFKYCCWCIIFSIVCDDFDLNRRELLQTFHCISLII